MNPHQVIKEELIVSLQNDLMLLLQNNDSSDQNSINHEPPQRRYPFNPHPNQIQEQVQVQVEDPTEQVQPSEEDPTVILKATTRLLAQLTTQYVERLVHAAVHAQDLFLDGAGGILPPPSFPRQPSSHHPVIEMLDPNHSSDLYPMTMERTDPMNWEEDLDSFPLPIITHHSPDECIRNSTHNSTKNPKKRSLHSATQSVSTNQKQSISIPTKKMKTYTSCIVPLSSNTLLVHGNGNGNLHAQHPKEAFVKMHDSYIYKCTNFIPLTVDCFLFPICHDRFLYSQIVHILELFHASTPMKNAALLSSLSSSSSSTLSNTHGNINRFLFSILYNPILLHVLQEERKNRTAHKTKNRHRSSSHDTL